MKAIAGFIIMTVGFALGMAMLVQGDVLPMMHYIDLWIIAAGGAAAVCMAWSILFVIPIEQEDPEERADFFGSGAATAQTRVVVRLPLLTIQWERTSLINSPQMQMVAV